MFVHQVAESSKIFLISNSDASVISAAYFYINKFVWNQSMPEFKVKYLIRMKVRLSS